MPRRLDDDDYGDWLYEQRRDRELDEMGVRPRPSEPKPAPRPAPDMTGVWYPDGVIPH